MPRASKAKQLERQATMRLWEKLKAAYVAHSTAVLRETLGGPHVTDKTSATLRVYSSGPGALGFSRTFGFWGLKSLRLGMVGFIRVRV